MVKKLNLIGVSIVDSTFVQAKHECSGYTAQGGWGSAFDYCNEDGEGRFWVSNDEYVSQANYCPFCGKKAPTQAVIENYKTS